MGILSNALIAQLDTKRSRAKSVADLEERILSLFHAGQATFPTIVVDEVAFARHLGVRLAQEDDLAAALDATRGPDFYLACACALGNDRAIRAFEKNFLRDIPGAVGRLKLDKSAVSEVMQLVRQRLLVADDGPPKIAEYAGRGPLENWVRVVAVRTALTLLRKDAAGRRIAAPEKDGIGEALLNVASPEHDPEMGLIKARYAGVFRKALAESLAQLSAQDRTILRLHFVDGLNIDQIGAIYRVHRATVARWIAKSRETLLSETKTALKAALRLSGSEFDSMMREVRSQLHLSLSGLLRSRAE